MSAAPQAEPMTIDGILVTLTEDGYYVSEDGEVLGMAEIRTEEDFSHEDVMRWRANAIAKATGFEAQRDMLIAGVRDRFEPLIAAQARKIAWIDDRLMPQVIERAKSRAQTLGQKKIVFEWGAIQFRKQGGGLEVVDDALAAETALEHCPEALKVTIDLSTLSEENRAKIVEIIPELLGTIKADLRKTQIQLPEEIEQQLPIATVDEAKSRAIVSPVGIVKTAVDEYGGRTISH